MICREKHRSGWAAFAIGSLRTAGLLAVGTIGGYLIAMASVASAMPTEEKR